MPRYYEFDVAMKDIKPRIWRRMRLPVSATFGDLHDAIQDASGSWVNEHLHAFRTSFRGDEICGTPGDDVFDSDTRDSRRTRLSKWFPVRTPTGRRPRCVYCYDFGDGWRAEVVLRRILESDETFGRRLVAGDRRFPPGGLHGHVRIRILLPGRPLGGCRLRGHGCRPG